MCPDLYAPGRNPKGPTKHQLKFWGHFLYFSSKSDAVLIRVCVWQRQSLRPWQLWWCQYRQHQTCPSKEALWGVCPYHWAVMLLWASTRANRPLKTPTHLHLASRIKNRQLCQIWRWFNACFSPKETSWQRLLKEIWTCLLNLTDKRYKESFVSFLVKLKCVL